jgi:hypothetical protein
MFIKGVWLQTIGTIGLALVLIIVGTALSVHADIAKWEWYVAFAFTSFCGFPLMGDIVLQCMGEANLRHSSPNNLLAFSASPEEHPRVQHLCGAFLFFLVRRLRR